MDTALLLADRLRDRRSHRVVFLSHCLLDESTRYLGGAGHPGCVPEIVRDCVDRGWGMVQLPCPEQAAWGGVLKRRMLWCYGRARPGTPAARLVGAVAKLATAWTRLVCRSIARRTVREIADYRRSGFTVTGIVAVDGSPTCGLHETIDLAGCLRDLASADPERLTVAAHEAIVRRHARPGRGLFVAELERALARHDLDIPFGAHDLPGEVAGRASRSPVADELDAGTRIEVRRAGG